MWPKRLLLLRKPERNDYISPFPSLCMGVVAGIHSYTASTLKMKAPRRKADWRDEKKLGSGITVWQYLALMTSVLCEIT